MQMQKTEIRNNVYIKIEHDTDTESPLEYDCFEFVNGWTDRDRYAELREELNTADYGKTWWYLDCYRHGNEVWSLTGEGYQCVFDTSRKCGILHLPSRDPSEVGKDPKKAAEDIIETYNKWVSGDTWWYRIEYAEYVHEGGTCPCCDTENVVWRTDRLVEYDSCGGFIGQDHAQQEILSSLETLLEANPYLLNGEVCVFSESIGFEADIDHEVENLVKKIKETNLDEDVAKCHS
jgi:hypothetical protein